MFNMCSLIWNYVFWLFLVVLNIWDESGFTRFKRRIGRRGSLRWCKHRTFSSRFSRLLVVFLYVCSSLRDLLLASLFFHLTFLLYHELEHTVAFPVACNNRHAYASPSQSCHTQLAMFLLPLPPYWSGPFDLPFLALKLVMPYKDKWSHIPASNKIPWNPDVPCFQSLNGPNPNRIKSLRMAFIALTSFLM